MTSLALAPSNSWTDWLFWIKIFHTLNQPIMGIIRLIRTETGILNFPCTAGQTSYIRFSESLPWAPVACTPPPPYWAYAAGTARCGLLESAIISLGDSLFGKLYPFQNCKISIFECCNINDLSVLPTKAEALICKFSHLFWLSLGDYKKGGIR